eukprot:1348660-Rhodomonas_salina.1
MSAACHRTPPSLLISRQSTTKRPQQRVAHAPRRSGRALARSSRRPGSPAADPKHARHASECKRRKPEKKLGVALDSERKTWREVRRRSSAGSARRLKLRGNAS